MTTEPDASEYAVHDPTLEGVEREPNFDMPYMTQISDDYELEGVEAK